MEGYINLFLNEHEGTNRPHYKLLFKIDGVDHEAALWPQKDGKKGFTGKYKLKQEPTGDPSATQAYVQKSWDAAQAALTPKKETIETGAMPEEEKTPF